MTIHTERLDLVRLTPALLRASLAGRRQEVEMGLGLNLPAGWPDCRDLLALRLAQVEKEACMEPWLLRAMRLRETGAMVGHIGFHTPPDAEYLRELCPGSVEFGYTVYPEYRRRGLAREACRALMHWAWKLHGVARFVVSISPENIPSQNLAAQLGFVRIGSHIDEKDGLEEIFRKEMGD